MLYPDRKFLLASDTQLSVAVTSGRGDDALDLVWLLYELDDDREGNLEMGMYHCRPSSPTALPFSSPSPSSLHSPKLHSPVSVRSRSKSPSPSHHKSGQDLFRWQSVPTRKPPQTYPHSIYIPSTNPSNARRAFGGNANGKGGKGDVGELQQQPQRPGRMRERNDLLRQAAGAWKSGNKKNRGGEVAAYFAERAREVQEMARKEQLDKARLMVEAKRSTPQSRDTVDLHGTTISEATTIVKEILQQDGSSPTKPLTIITGRGTHSTHGVGVLGPAVKAALIEDGWHVGMFDGGLMVKGKKGLHAR